jgi:hypothetical protein
MLLRSTLEKHLPLKAKEVRLSKSEKDYAFHGTYAWLGRVIKFETTKNYNPTTKDNFPYRHTAIREESNGLRHQSGDSHFSSKYRDPETDAVTRLNSPEVLARVNRVERIAIRMKATTAFAMAAALLTFGIIEQPYINSLVEQTQSSTANCSQVIDGTETLIPVDAEQESAAQRLGETVCRLGDYDFIVSPNPNN